MSNIGQTIFVLLCSQRRIYIVKIWMRPSSLFNFFGVHFEQIIDWRPPSFPVGVPFYQRLPEGDAKRKRGGRQSIIFFKMSLNLVMRRRVLTVTMECALFLCLMEHF